MYPVSSFSIYVLSKQKNEVQVKIFEILTAELRRLNSRAVGARFPGNCLSLNFCIARKKNELKIRVTVRERFDMQWKRNSRS